MSSYCQARVDRPGTFHGSQCLRAGKYEEFGGHYCKQHLPSLVKARSDEKYKRVEDDYESKRALDEAKRLVAGKEQEVIERARITARNGETKKLKKALADLDLFLTMASNARNRIHELNKEKK